MHPRWFILIVIMASAAVCGVTLRMERKPASSDSSNPAKRAVVDATGQPVGIPLSPQRIVSLSTTVTDTIIRLGESARLVAIDDHGRIIPGAEQLPTVGRAAALSRESLLAIRPDLAFIWWYQQDAAAVFQDIGVPVVRVRCNRAADIAGVIQVVGKCLSCAARADTIAAPISAIRSRPLQATSSGPPVYVELYGPFKTMGAQTYLNDLIEAAGARNVAADTTGSVLLSPERLIQANPEIILYISEFTSTESIAGRNGLQSLRAVKEKRLMPIPRYWLVAGAGFPEMVQNVRQVLEE